jgi:hypothetical protein
MTMGRPIGPSPDTIVSPALTGLRLKLGPSSGGIGVASGLRCSGESTGLANGVGPGD